MQRSLAVDLSNFSRKKRLSMPQIIVDQNRKPRENDYKDGQTNDDQKVRFKMTRVQSEQEVDKRIHKAPEIISHTRDLSHFPSIANRSLNPNNTNSELCELERIFTFSRQESPLQHTINDKTSITTANRFKHSLEQRVIREAHSAVRLNKKIFEKSSTSALVVLNLPEPPKKESALSNYMEYLNVLTNNLRRVLLIRGSGSEVITMYS
ncbi:unnamed protein product [Thelazia callipaeda]|uniref:SLC12 domain-containing protein n=1 Tax=Thelazia callipaeda TaxID=103827 RepID=A0A0N5DBP1_THECL|nr:unnamed protein product [Thelazia callipaeda]